MIDRGIASLTILSIIAVLILVNLEINYSYAESSGINNILCNDEVKSQPVSWSPSTGYVKYQGQSWQGTGKISTDNNNDITVNTNSYWFDQYAWHPFSQPLTDFTISMCVKVLNDSPINTNFGMQVGSMDSQQSQMDENKVSADRVQFWHDGVYNLWRVNFGKEPVFQTPTSPIPKEKWVELTIQKTGNNWEFFADNQLITKIERPFLTSVNFVSVSNGDGLQNGGTAAIWKTLTISFHLHWHETGQKNIIASSVSQNSHLTKTELQPMAIMKPSMQSSEEPDLLQKYPPKTITQVLAKDFNVNTPLQKSKIRSDNQESKNILPFVLVPSIPVAAYQLIKSRIVRKIRAK